MINQLKNEFWPLIILIFTGIFSIVTNPLLPDRVITHWNFQGQADGWSSKGFHSWFFVIFMIGIYALFLILPKLDPKKNNYQAFKASYQTLKIIFLSFFASIFVIATLANLNMISNISYVITPLIGILMICIGQILKNIKTNWFIGIKTPWTLSNDKVWDATHKMAAKIFLAWGFSFFVLPFLRPNWALAVFLLGIISVVFGTSVYSYLLYKKELKK